VTSTTPVPAGDVAVMVVALTTTTLVSELVPLNHRSQSVRIPD